MADAPTQSTTTPMAPPLPPAPTNGITNSSTTGGNHTIAESSTAIPSQLPPKDAQQFALRHSMSTIGTDESKVLFMKPLPKNIIEPTVRDALEVFGPVESVIILRRPMTTQALVQMAELEDARKIMGHYHATLNPLIFEEESMDHTEMHEIQVNIEYSKSQELRGSNHSSQLECSNNTKLGYARSLSIDQPHTGQRILLMTFHGLADYAITTNLLSDIFSVYGSVQKVVVFNKSVGLQALVQFEEPQNALDAKTAMNSFNLTPNENDNCQVWINYSKLSELTVRENGLRSRDFTNPDLPVPEVDVPVDAFSEQQQSQHAHLYTNGHNNTTSLSGHHQLLPPQQSLQPQGSPVLLFTNLHEELVTCDMLFNLVSCYGTVLKIRKLFTKPGHAFVQMENYHVALRVMGHLRGFQLFHLPLEIQESKHFYISYHHHRTSRAGFYDHENNNVDGQSIDESSSENTQVEQHLYYKEFTRKENRFTGKFASSSRYMTNPTLVLHVSNLSVNMLEADIHAHFAQYEQTENTLTDGTIRPKCQIAEIKKFDRNEHAQALLRFESIEEATDMLAMAHNSSFNDKQLKIAFSTHSMDTSLSVTSSNNHSANTSAFSSGGLPVPSPYNNRHHYSVGSDNSSNHHH